MRNLDERQAAEEKIAKETTQLYRAPEMVDLYLRPVLTVKTDIWALGCMLYAMCFLAHPFQDGSSLGILNAKITFPADSPYDPDTMHALILRLLDVSAVRIFASLPFACTRNSSGRRCHVASYMSLPCHTHAAAAWPSHHI